MRSLTLATRAALAAQETDDVFLILVALTHETMSPQYFVNNTTDIVSQGIHYQAFPVDVLLPDDRDDEISRVRLTIDNIDRRVVEAVRSISSPARITISVIRAAEPDVIIDGPIACILRNVSIDALVISGDLWPHDDIQNEPIPQHAFTPANFPGMFG